MNRHSSRGSGLFGAASGALAGLLVYWIGISLLLLRPLIRQPDDTLEWIARQSIQTVTFWEVAAVLLGAGIGFLVARYRWRPFAVTGYIGIAALALGYVTYAVTYSIPRVPAEDRWLSILLFVAEAAGIIPILIFSFYSLDSLARRRWPQRSDARPYDPQLRPKVALIVPVYNEPPEMVQRTIALLTRLNYPRDAFTVHVADDSTDPEARRQLAAYCRDVGAVHVVRRSRRGFKAGALNHVIDRLPRDVQLIGVIDADYWVEPDFLAETVGYFTDPRLSFVQTPQDYRNQNASFLTRQYARADAYFYHAILPSRNEENSIIFCGTMGVIRRAAIEDVNGFDENQICEDADIGLRLAARGWTSLYLDKSFGKGLMPSTFDVYKKQFHRWAFGSARILVDRTRMVLTSRMTKRQKFDFLASNLHWFDGISMLAIASVLLFLGLAPLFGFDPGTHHHRELWLVGLIPLFLTLDGLLRLRALLPKEKGVGLGRALLVQGLWLSIKVTNMKAAVKAVLGVRTPFVRTPKEPPGRSSRLTSLTRTVRVTWTETLIGTALWATAFATLTQPAPTPGIRGFLLPIWLLVYGMFFLCAPTYAYLSYRTLAKPGPLPSIVPLPLHGRAERAPPRPKPLLSLQ